MTLTRTQINLLGVYRTARLAERTTTPRCVND